MPLNFVDSHCHLEMLDLSDFNDHMDHVIDEAKENQVSDILSICVDLNTFSDLLSTAKKYPNIHASVGLHPCHSPEIDVSVEQLLELADDPKVIAIGETGLDYYMNDGIDPRNNNFAWQRTRFRTHIQAAIQTEKPLIIHTRDAREDTLRILAEEEAYTAGGIMHCFVEDHSSAEKALAMGFYISFSGIVTFKNAKSIQEVARSIPDDRLLIETDSPYLAPVPMRGKKNQPAYVAYVAEFLAQLRGVSVAHIAQITRENYFRLFKL
jgi:TatD DNase family protein